MRRFGFGLLILSVLALNAYAIPFLGPAWNFSVLGASTVTNTGATTLNANLGVSPGTAVTGSGTITFSGAPPNNRIVTQSEAAAGQGFATTAYNDIAALASNGSFATGILDGQTVNAAGANTVIDVGAAAFNLNSGQVLTLNFGGASNENIIFRMSSTLIADVGSSVKVIGADSTDNVFWQVGSSATLNGGVSFVGNIIAHTDVSLLAAVTIGCGSVVARGVGAGGGVTMINDTISGNCSYGVGGTVTPTLGSGTTTVVIPPGGITEAVPEGGSTFLYLGFLLVPIGAMRAFRRRSL
jgi:hypothetical protein